MVFVIFLILALLVYNLIFVDSKSNLTKLKEALKDTSTEELKFVVELIINEINSRQ